MRVLRFAVFAAAVALPGRVHSATYPPPVEGDFVLRDFRFASGESLPELRIHYRTLGTPSRDAAGVVRNAVLVLHGTGGSGAGFLSENFAGRLFGAGQPLDAARHFIVLPDGIGHGRSSKPSDGLRMRFPRYNYDDMLRAQHRLLREGLGVDHLFLVMGTSMGGMHTWVWGETYPDFMDGLVPLAAVPTQIAGRNRILRKMILDAIREDPEWKGGEYREQPRRGLSAAMNILMLMTSSPLQWHKAAPTRDQADAYLASFLKRRLETTDANDTLYHFDASRDYDPSKDLEKIQAPVLAINSADDLVNPPELGLMQALMPRVKRGRYVLIPTGPETRGHGTHSQPAIWGPHLEAFLKELRAAPGAGAAAAGGRIALTFDDLPVHGPLPPGKTRIDVFESILLALRKAQAPPTYGFVNANALEDGGDNARALELWRAAGHPLANHTFSHIDLHRSSPEAFLADVAANERVLAAKMEKQDWKWLRYPYLREGDTLEKRRAVRAALERRGYRVAQVTVSFDDYAYNAPYARCLARQDEQAIEWLKQSYLSRASESLAAAQADARRIYGRDIDHVMLLHVGGFQMPMLPKLLELLRERGLTLTTLEQAQREPAYAIDPDLAMRGGATLLDQMRIAKSIEASPRGEPPFARLAALCADAAQAAR
jgi:homoserine O-acetyltransferase